MATGKITKRSVDALKSADRDVFLWDSDRKGFGFKRTPSGKGVFLIQYRLHGGRASKTKRYTIGPLGVWTPDSAGKEAERLLRMVAQGTDPAVERRRARHDASALAIGNFADRFYNEEVIPNWERSHESVETAIRLHIKPHIGEIAMPSFGTRDLAAHLARFESDAVRYRTFAVLRRMFRWAKSQGHIEINPIADFEGPSPPDARDRWLKDHEIAAFWRATSDLGTLFGTVYRLLLLTGQRKSQVSGMKWQELDREKAVWIIPATRAKNKNEHAVPLTRMVIKELDDLAGGEKWPKSGLIFTTTGKTPVSGFSKIKGKLDKLMLQNLRESDQGAELDDWVNHDLRRTMATNMQRLRIPNEHIEAVESRIAGRSKPGSAGVYLLWEFYEEKREALEKWDGFLTALLSGSDNIVPLAKKAS